MRHTEKPRAHGRRGSWYGGGWRYLAFWAAGTAAAVLAALAGTLQLRSAGSGNAGDLPTITPPPPTAQPAPPSAAPPPSAISRPPKRKGKPSPPARRRAGERLPAGVRGVTIDAPRARSYVNGRVGVVVRGRAGDLEGGTLRLFVLAYNGLHYLIDNGPVITADRKWSFLLKPIGAGTTDIGRVFTIIAVVADKSCRRILESSNRDPEGNIAFPVLPPGCADFDRVDVIKNGS
jgi:hypothetical protein